jgi:hypothetical protein
VLTWRARSLGLEVGARFRATGANSFGQPSGRVWRVQDVFDASDGNPHARLIDSLNEANSKTVSVSALLDSHLYQRAS